jgi:molybdopterin-guanine dinucleotide biosynthesis protein B
LDTLFEREQTEAKGPNAVIPVVCFVGKHNAGKTTLLESLIPCLQERGRRIAAIKHAAHGFSLDQEGSDSWRLAQAGAETVLLSGPESTVTFCRVADAASLTHLVGLLPPLGIDLVLAEGFKQAHYPKIEVHRTDLGSDLLMPEDELEAVVSDGRQSFGIPNFNASDAHGLAAFLNERFPPPHVGQNTIRLTVDGEDIPVNAFASSVLTGGILGMLSALKGVNKPCDVRIELRRGQSEED